MTPLGPYRGRKFGGRDGGIFSRTSGWISTKLGGDQSLGVPTQSKAKKGVNFKNLLLQTQEPISQDMLCVYTLIYEEYKLFMTRPRMAPLGPYRG